MKLSIIIPTFNEASCIEETLKRLLAGHNPDEVIVVDGGSQDETLRLAEKFEGVSGQSSRKGRASQMNFGAEVAGGDIFIFLHADTLLPKGALDVIKESISGGVEAGRFRMQFDDRRFSLRLFETYTHLSCFSYGDQCFFVTKELFEKLHGYDESAPFEDVDFYKRLSRMTKPKILKQKVITSARRFCQVGCMRQKFINLFLIGLYYLGFNVFGLKKKLYADVR